MGKRINLKIYWVVIVSIFATALGFGIWYPLIYSPNPVNQPLIEQQQSRASGFTMKGDAVFQKSGKTGKLQAFARMYATGPMHDDEVIRMEGNFTLITPDGKQQSFGPITWTFAENLESVLPVKNAPAGSIVKIKGFVHVYHREEIKTEREMLGDGSVRLYMNTGTVTFRKVPGSIPPKLEVECLDLNSVHRHGLELMGKDKKTVSNRILLMSGKQTIERENLPYLGRQLGMEPYLVRQLIPKRNEPVTLVIPVSEKTVDIN